MNVWLFWQKNYLYVLSFLCLHWLSIQFLNNDKIWDPVSYNVFHIKKKHMGVMFCLYGPYPIFEHKGMTLYSKISTKDEWKKYFFVYKGITQFWVLKRWKNNFYSNRRACPYIRKLGPEAMKKIIFTRTEGHALIFELWAPLPIFRLQGCVLIFKLLRYNLICIVEVSC